MSLSISSDMFGSDILGELVHIAQTSGASDVAIISTQDIVVENHLADICREPGCPNYGSAKSCPPHVAGPDGFRKALENFERALFFKIDVPSEILLSSENREVFQLLHQVAAGIETAAVKMGYGHAQAYAGGSCKKIFCHDHPECRALSEQGDGQCRHPDHARPSMSGFGIDVTKLFEAAGWTMTRARIDPDEIEDKMSHVCGLVLIC